MTVFSSAITRLSLALAYGAAFAVSIEPVRAFELAGRSSTDERKMRINILGESAVLKVGDDLLTAAGLRVGFQYNLFKRYGIELTIAQTLSPADGGVKALYLGLTAAFNVAVIGSLQQQSTTHQVLGRNWIKIGNDPTRSLLYLQAGVEQIYFNGSSSIYPVSGVTAGAFYTRSIFDSPVIFGVRGGFLAGNEKKISSLFFNLGLAFDLQ